MSGEEIEAEIASVNPRQYPQWREGDDFPAVRLTSLCHRPITSSQLLELIPEGGANGHGAMGYPRLKSWLTSIKKFNLVQHPRPGKRTISLRVFECWAGKNALQATGARRELALTDQLKHKLACANGGDECVPRLPHHIVRAPEKSSPVSRLDDAASAEPKGREMVSPHA